MNNMYGTIKRYEILPMQATDAATLIGAGSVPYSTGPCVDTGPFTGWGRMTFDVWAFTGASGITGPATGATGTLTLTPWAATYAVNRGGTTHATGLTGDFYAGSTSALTMYATPGASSSSSFTAASFSNANTSSLNQVRYWDVDNTKRWVGAGVTVAGSAGPKFAFMATVDLIAKVRPQT